MKQTLNTGLCLRMGWVVALSTLLPLGLGVLLDRRLGTGPLYLFICAVVGIIAGTVGIVWLGVRTIDALGRVPEAEADTEEEVVGKGDGA